jgi:hypothetical protein
MSDILKYKFDDDTTLKITAESSDHKVKLEITCTENDGSGISLAAHLTKREFLAVTNEMLKAYCDLPVEDTTSGE